MFRESTNSDDPTHGLHQTYVHREGAHRDPKRRDLLTHVMNWYVFGSVLFTTAYIANAVIRWAGS